jgi:hypothetical protein
MRVFISWSGDRSKQIGEVLRGWIPSVLQAVRPYFSPDDIAKGARWGDEIAKELDASRIGILILTAENLEAPWLMFESGALAKGLDKSRVCPLLCGIEPADIKGPLVQFQGAKFDRDEIWRLVKMLNTELGESALSPETLEDVFKMWWPRLEERVKAHLQMPKAGEKSGSRTDRDILEEVLSISRSVLRSSRSAPDVSPEAIDSLVVTLARMREMVAGTSQVPTPVVEAFLTDLQRPLKHLLFAYVDRGLISPKHIDLVFREISPSRGDSTSSSTPRST